MKVVILAAGEGTRMRPLTCNRPKVMLPLANKPILEYLLVECREAGLRDFVFVVGYHDEQIRNYFNSGAGWNVNIEYVSQRRQMGTANALEIASELLSENFLMLNGDMIINHKNIAMLANCTNTTMSLFRVRDTSNLGAVTVEQDHVVRIYEKTKTPPSTLANAGLYLFTPKVFSAIGQTAKSLRGEYEITDSIQFLIDSGQKVGYQMIDYWVDLSYPWQLLSANEYLLTKIQPQQKGKIEENAVIRGKVQIGENTEIRAGSYIVGPVVIGDNCSIGPNCYIRPGSAVGNNCHVGNACEVKNSIIMNGSKIPHQNYVGDSVIGENCNLGSGTKIANLKLDKSHVFIDGKDTRRQKLGTIMGDGVQTGINSCINVGSVIGNDCRIGPGAIVSGTIAPGTKIY